MTKLMTWTWENEWIKGDKKYLSNKNVNEFDIRLLNYPNIYLRHPSIYLPHLLHHSTERDTTVQYIDGVPTE